MVRLQNVLCLEVLLYINPDGENCHACYLSVSVWKDEGEWRSHSEPQQVPERVEEGWGGWGR